MGYPITVFTDQTNYAFNGLKPLARVVRWVLLLEEYGVQFQYIIGRKNVGFYALSRLDMRKLPQQWLKIATLLDTAMETNTKIPMHIALIHQEQLKNRGLKEKVTDKPHYSLQNI
jgi:hypothetical protein